MGNSSNLHLFEDALYEHQGSFEALGEKLAPGERQLVIRFMEDLLRLRSERTGFFFDGENGDGPAVPEIFGEGGGVQELGHIDLFAGQPRAKKSGGRQQNRV